MRNLGVGLGLTYFAVVVLAFIGWVMNIITLIDAPALAQWGALEVLRVVGIFVAPLGAVLGWF